MFFLGYGILSDLRMLWETKNLTDSYEYYLKRVAKFFLLRRHAFEEIRKCYLVTKSKLSLSKM